MSDEKQFHVDRILDKMDKKNGKVLNKYLLSWKGFGSEDNSWEPKSRH